MPNVITLRRIGGGLLLFWFISLISSIILTLRQPDQLGVPEAYVYWRLVGEGPAWAYFLALFFLHLSSTEGRERTVLEPNRVRWVEWKATPQYRIRAAGRFLIGWYVIAILLGLLLGFLHVLEPYNPIIDRVFNAICEPPAWILAVGLVAVSWRSE